MESDIILEICQTLVGKGCIPAEIVLDGDATTSAVLRKAILHYPEVRLYGGETVIDLKADDRHHNKTTKDRFNEISRKHACIVDKIKYVPLVAPQG